MTLIPRVQIAPGEYAPASEYPRDTIRVYINETHYVCYQPGDDLPPEPALEA